MDEWSVSLPLSYSEVIDAEVFEMSGLGRAFSIALGGAVGLGVGAWLSEDHKALTSAAGGAAAAYATSVLLKQGEICKVRVNHHFTFKALTAAEQAKLSVDKRNMSFRLARGLETTFGFVVYHTIDFDYCKCPPVESVLSTFTSKSGRYTSLSWKPVPPGSHIVPLGRTAERSCGLALELPRNFGYRCRAGDVRKILTDIVPCIDGFVADSTLFQWMATHPRFMDMGREFSNVKDFLRMSYCTNGQIINDLTSGDFNGLYTATSVLTLVQFLRMKTLFSAGLLQATQEWGF